MSCKVTKKSFNNDLKNLILDNNWESLGIKSNLDTSNSKPTTYVDRVEIFVPFDSSNPNKDILFGKLKNLESQINKVYQSGEYGNVIQTQMKSDGGVISIQSTDKLLNALNEQYSGEQDPSGNVKEFKSWVGNKNNSQNSQERLNAIQEVFNQNPELSKIGTVEQYASYLDTIFPNSKVKDIVYHGTREGAKFDKFKKEYIGSSASIDDSISNIANAIFFSSTYEGGKTWASIFGNKEIQNAYNNIEETKKNIIIAEKGIKDKDYSFVEKLREDTFYSWHTEKQKLEIAKEVLDRFYNRLKKYNLLLTSKEFKDKVVLSAIIDIKNPFIYNNKSGVYQQNVEKRNIKEAKENKKDSVITDNIQEFGSTPYSEYAVFEPEQIHILSSKADIQGFKDFVQGKQFQKLTAEEKAKTIEQVTKEHRSIAALKDLAHKLAYRIGGKVEFQNHSNVDWKGYNQGMKSMLNEAYMTPDTPFHEILAHPIIRAIKNKGTVENKYVQKGQEVFDSKGNWITAYFDVDAAKKFVEEHNKPNSNLQQLYKNLLKELEYGRGKEVFEQVKRDYKYKESLQDEKLLDNLWEENGKYYFFDEYAGLSGEDGRVEITKEKYNKLTKKREYTLEEQQEEAIVTLLGMMAADKLDAKKDAILISKLKELWKEISDFVKQLLLQDSIKIDELPITTTLNDLAEIMAYGNNKIILPGYKIEYSTPLGNKYDTLEEVNNEIRGLTDNVEVDLSGVKIPKNLKDIPNEFTIILPFGDYIVRNEDGIWNKYEYDKNIIGRLVDKNLTFEEVKREYLGSSSSLDNFIEKNKQYEQSKEIIEQWKKENNIQYDPKEVYSRGQGFYSSIGAYSNLELDLLLKNLIQHIEDNKKAGGEFTISAFTKPIDKRLKHIEGTGDRVRFVIYPKSNHIKWAAPTDVYSGSVWDAHEKVSKDKKSELLGVSFTKAPTLRNINEVSPNLADIIDNLSHVHNELGIELTTNNFRIEYDDNIDYSTKKLIDNINKILDDKYGKLVKPEIKKEVKGKKYQVIIEDQTDYEGYKEIKGIFETKEEAEKLFLELDKTNPKYTPESALRVVEIQNMGKQPTQTKENTTSIESVKNKTLNIFDNSKYVHPELGSMDGYNNFESDEFKLDTDTFKLLYNVDKKTYNVAKKFPKYWQAVTKSNLEYYSNIKGVQVSKIIEEQKKLLNEKIEEYNKKEYTSQALTNLKVAALKEVARKYPRSLITSKVVPINPNMVDNSEIQYSKVGSKQDIENFAKFVKNSKLGNVKDMENYMNSKSVDYIMDKLIQSGKIEKRC